MRSNRLALIVPAVACLALLAACGDDGDDSAEAEATSAPSDVARTGDCEWVPSDGPVGQEVDPPAEDAEPADVVTLQTSAGDIPITLDQEAVCAATSFTWLAEQGYYDDAPCHRLIVAADDVPYGILQCGDPTGTGTAGPGYTFADELSGDETYPAGSVAMANAGPDTNGSQFFLNYADSEFTPDYTVFGTIEPEGLEVLESIAATGTDNGGTEGAPAQEVLIESASTS